MIRKCTDEDISDEELEKVINPFYDNYHEYIITYVMPEVISFYIASSYLLAYLPRRTESASIPCGDAQKAAAKVLSGDPELKKAENQRLRNRITALFTLNESTMN